MIVDPDVEKRPWAAQATVDDPVFRRQVAYLFFHSRFYREKLVAAGFESAEEVGGLANLAALPFTEKDELRASRSAADPVGTHLAVAMEKLARIFSTSGTTG